jgi:hypothetical protein
MVTIEFWIPLSKQFGGKPECHEIKAYLNLVVGVVFCVSLRIA